MLMPADHRFVRIERRAGKLLVDEPLQATPAMRSDDWIDLSCDDRRFEFLEWAYGKTNRKPDRFHNQA